MQNNVLKTSYANSFNSNLIAGMKNESIGEDIMTKNILLATGGTGGHIFPALALKKELEDRNFNVKVTADDRFVSYHAFDKDHVFIPSANFVNKSPLKILKSIFTLTKGFFKALWFIHKYKPDVVIGFGGYPTYPVMLAAMVMSKEIILHEANVVIGKVNKLLLCKAKYLTTGFKNIKGVPDKYKNKIIYTGNPVRSEITSTFLELKNDKLSIFIIGGSQGAKIFSKIVPDAIVNLPQEIKDNIYVCQQAREEDIEIIKARYAKENIECEIQSFFTDMNEKFSQANLVIARSGASTISELVRIGLPAIFIPYPTAADDHQYYNAKEILDLGACWLIKEDRDSHIQLIQIIKTIHKDPSILTNYSKTLHKEDQNASENIVNIINTIFYS